jgi:hypothetical protein
MRCADWNLVNMMGNYDRGYLWVIDCKGVKQCDEIFTPTKVKSSSWLVEK